MEIARGRARTKGRSPGKRDARRRGIAVASHPRAKPVSRSSNPQMKNGHMRNGKSLVSVGNVFLIDSCRVEFLDP